MDASTLNRASLLPRSRRLLAAFSDERLVKEAQRGSEAAFEVIYDRYHRQLLTFCRHMLGSREDAEDAVQHAFSSAFRALPGNEHPAQLKAWLYPIVRNRALTVLRARKDEPVRDFDGPSFEGLSDKVEQRAELKELVADLQDLPERQREALVLAEVSGLGHLQVAEVLDCEVKQVKALVYQARTALLQNRAARDIPCAEIREEIANATGKDLRRSHLRRHVRSCEGCVDFEQQVRRQRAMLAVALPAVPSLGLKEAVAAAAGIGGGGAAGGGGGLIAALGASSAGKVAAVAIAAGGAVGGVAATEPSLVEAARSGIERAAAGVGQAASGELDRKQAEEKAASEQAVAEDAARAEQAKGGAEKSSPTSAVADRRAPSAPPARSPEAAGSPSRPTRATLGSSPDGSKAAPPGRAQAPRGANPSRGASRAPGSRGAGPGTRRSGRSAGRPSSPGRRLSPGRVLKPVPPVKPGARRVLPAPRGTLGRSPGSSRAPNAPGGPRR